MHIEYYIEVLRLLDTSDKKTMAELSAATALSSTSLKWVLRDLKKHQLIEIKEGHEGGILLVKPYKLIKVRDIIPLIDKRNYFCAVLARRLRFQPLSILVEENT